MTLMNKLDDLATRVLNFHIDFNPHRVMYQSLDRYISCNSLESSLLEGTDKNNDIYLLQVYEFTPVSCLIYMGNDLNKLIEHAIQNLQNKS